MNKQFALAALLAAASSTAAAADGLSHTYLEAGFAHQQAELPLIEDGVSVDDMKANGGFIAGSVEVSEHLYLIGGYLKGNDDVGVSIDGAGQIGEIDTDAQQAYAGLGYRHTLSDRVEWTGELSYVNTRIELKVEDFKEYLKGDDYRASIGLRGDLAANFEGWIKANYIDGDVYDGEFSGTIGALIKFNEMWGIVAEGDLGANTRQYTVGVRASF